MKQPKPINLLFLSNKVTIQIDFCKPSKNQETLVLAGGCKHFDVNFYARQQLHWRRGLHL